MALWLRLKQKLSLCQGVGDGASWPGLMLRVGAARPGRGVAAQAAT